MLLMWHAFALLYLTLYYFYYEPKLALIFMNFHVYTHMYNIMERLMTSTHAFFNTGIIVSHTSY